MEVKGCYQQQRLTETSVAELQEKVHLDACTGTICEKKKRDGKSIQARVVVTNCNNMNDSYFVVSHVFSGF
jgi:hypothetical protein